MFEKNAGLLENAFALCLYRFSQGKSQRYLTNYSYLSKEQSGAQKLQSGGASQALLSGENSEQYYEPQQDYMYVP